MTAVTRAPARLSGTASVGAAVLALGTSGYYSWSALAVGAVGVATLLLGLARGSRSPITVGAGMLVVAALVAGVQRAPVLPVLAGVALAVVAWDAGGFAVGVGDQLGRETDTTRLEAVHVGASALVGVVTVGVGYGLYRTATGGQPVAALVFLLVAAVLLVETLR